MADTDSEVDSEVAGNTSAATSGLKARAWFLTIFEGYQDAIEQIAKEKCRYCCWQIEKCPTTGRLHVHACIYYENQQKWPKDRYPTAHIRKVKNLKKCISYCMKDDTREEGPWQLGIKPEPGRRTDLETLAVKIMKGTTAKELAKEDPVAYIRYHRGLKALEEACYSHRSKAPDTVEWIWGATGVGKSHRATERPGTYYMKDGTKWWDGYTQQNTIVIDDFDGKWPLRDLLRLLDRYPYQGQTKGGYVAVNSEAIIITCDRPPSGFYSGIELDQMLRRMKVIHLEKRPEEEHNYPAEDSGGVYEERYGGLIRTDEPQH